MLKPLPLQDVDAGERRDATLHADCYVLVEAVLYGAPHIHRHKKLRIKLTKNSIEIFLNPSVWRSIRAAVVVMGGASSTTHTSRP